MRKLLLITALCSLLYTPPKGYTSEWRKVEPLEAWQSDVEQHSIERDVAEISRKASVFYKLLLGHLLPRKMFIVEWDIVEGKARHVTIKYRTEDDAMIEGRLKTFAKYLKVLIERVKLF